MPQRQISYFQSGPNNCPSNHNYVRAHPGGRESLFDSGFCLWFPGARLCPVGEPFALFPLVNNLSGLCPLFRDGQISLLVLNGGCWDGDGSVVGGGLCSEFWGTFIGELLFFLIININNYFQFLYIWYESVSFIITLWQDSSYIEDKSIQNKVWRVKGWRTSHPISSPAENWL